jgi:hypothetical protein
VQQPGVIKPEGIRHREDRHVIPEVPDELRLLAEHQPPDCGVQPISTNDKSERPGRCVLETDQDPVVVGLNGGNRVAEDVLGVVPGRLVEDLAQVTAQDLHIPGEDLSRHPRHRVAVGVDVGGAAQVRLPVP